MQQAYRHDVQQERRQIEKLVEAQQKKDQFKQEPKISIIMHTNKRFNQRAGGIKAKHSPRANQTRTLASSPRKLDLGSPERSIL